MPSENFGEGIIPKKAYSFEENPERLLLVSIFVD
jgi:hypothetical protein